MFFHFDRAARVSSGISHFSPLAGIKFDDDDENIQMLIFFSRHYTSNFTIH